MSNIWNKDRKMMELISKHYNLELMASNLYFNFATKSKKMGYDSISNFFIELARDKQEAHLLRILDFFVKLEEEMPILESSVPKSHNNVNTIQELLGITMDVEISIRNLIWEICEYANQIKDYESLQRMQWFVKDTIKDINDVNDILTIVNVPNTSLLAIETAVYARNKIKKGNLYSGSDDLD